jgi:hypothetical protein
MAAHTLGATPYYQINEDGMQHLSWVRDSLLLLAQCSENSHSSSVDPLLLASHLSVLVEQLNTVIEQAAWAGKGARA